MLLRPPPCQQLRRPFRACRRRASPKGGCATRRSRLGVGLSPVARAHALGSDECISGCAVMPRLFSKLSTSSTGNARFYRQNNTTSTSLNMWPPMLCSSAPPMVLCVTNAFEFKRPSFRLLRANCFANHSRSYRVNFRIHCLVASLCC